jgi:hypothetical protein
LYDDENEMKIYPGLYMPYRKVYVKQRNNNKDENNHNNNNTGVENPVKNELQNLNILPQPSSSSFSSFSFSSSSSSSFSSSLSSSFSPSFSPSIPGSDSSLPKAIPDFNYERESSTGNNNDDDKIKEKKEDESKDGGYERENNNNNGKLKEKGNENKDFDFKREQDVENNGVDDDDDRKGNENKDSASKKERNIKNDDDGDDDDDDDKVKKEKDNKDANNDDNENKGKKRKKNLNEKEDEDGGDDESDKDLEIIIETITNTVSEKKKEKINGKKIKKTRLTKTGHWNYENTYHDIKVEMEKDLLEKRKNNNNNNNNNLIKISTEKFVFGYLFDSSSSSSSSSSQLLSSPTTLPFSSPSFFPTTPSPRLFEFPDWIPVLNYHLSDLWSEKCYGIVVPSYLIVKPTSNSSSSSSSSSVPLTYIELHLWLGSEFDYSTNFKRMDKDEGKNNKTKLNQEEKEKKEKDSLNKNIESNRLLISERKRNSKIKNSEAKYGSISSDSKLETLPSSQSSPKKNVNPQPSSSSGLFPSFSSYSSFSPANSSSTSIYSSVLSPFNKKLNSSSTDHHMYPQVSSTSRLSPFSRHSLNGKSSLAPSLPPSLTVFGQQQLKQIRAAWAVKTLSKLTTSERFKHVVNSCGAGDYIGGGNDNSVNNVVPFKQQKTNLSGVILPALSNYSSFVSYSPQHYSKNALPSFFNNENKIPGLLNESKHLSTKAKNLEMPIVSSPLKKFQKKKKVLKIVPLNEIYKESEEKNNNIK